MQLDEAYKEDENMIKSVHSVSLSVHDLEREVEFYQDLGLTIVSKHKVENDKRYDQFLGLQDVAYETVSFDTKLGLLKVMQIFSPKPAKDRMTMQVYSPGLTHVCFKSPATNPAYDRVKKVGSQMISRGDKPVDLAGAGITYAYARDPEGNIHEVEQLDNPDQDFDFWMGHFCLITHDIDRLSTFYNKMVLDNPDTPPSIHLKDHPRADDVADIDNIEIKGAWVRGLNLDIEIWQYLNPATTEYVHKRPFNQLGYNRVCFEIDDIDFEFRRLRDIGVEFLSDPIQFEDSIAVVGHDPDGNLFQLKQC